MSEFKKIEATVLNENLIDLLSNKWMLITTKNEEKVNMMTASWGGFGELWGKHVSYSVIRPSRYSYDNMENCIKYTLCFFDDNYKNELAYCGKMSGRDENKVGKTGFTVLEEDGYSYFKESKYVMCCKKLYSQKFEKECFVSNELADKIYPDEDIHKMFIGEIEYILVK